MVWGVGDERRERRERRERLLESCGLKGLQAFKKKSETELTASILKKRSQTHMRLKERFLIGRKRTKCVLFHPVKKFFEFFVCHGSTSLMEFISEGFLTAVVTE